MLVAQPALPASKGHSGVCKLELVADHDDGNVDATC